MEFLPQPIEDYAEQHTTPHSKLLDELFYYTVTHVHTPRMISGKLQGRWLSMVSHWVRPKRVLEIGTYTGYSALCLAEGLAPNGELHTIDINPQMQTVQKQFIGKSQYANQIHLHCGNALDLIPQMEPNWDLVFIDADKENYAQYYQMLLPLLPSGAVIIADNVLWSGKVLNESERKQDSSAQALHLFNDMVQKDPSVCNMLLPIRDGLMIVRKL